MKMNSLISWVGGKKSIRDLIYARFPQSYGRYIEVFGGGGWVLFGKKPDKFEVYNDFNNNLSNMFAVVRDQPLAFIQELGYLPENGRTLFCRIHKGRSHSLKGYLKEITGKVPAILQ